MGQIINKTTAKTSIDSLIEAKMTETGIVGIREYINGCVQF
jgi:hypothetical protein